jgi:hypothetical protein
MITANATIRRQFGEATRVALTRFMATVNSSFRDAQNLRPFDGGLRSSIKGKPNVPSFIPPLFVVRCPSHIAGLVVTVTIFAIERVMRGWLETHFRKELLKRIKAKFNTPAAVDVVSTILGVITPLLSRCKGPVFRRTAHAVRSSYSGIVLASARLCSTCRQPDAGNDRILATVAFTEPVKFFIWHAFRANGCKFAELLAEKILKLRTVHGRNVIGVLEGV